MTALVWDKVGEKSFESGIDRGVLYLPNGVAVPWNGLTSVTEASNNQSSPVYYDGRKISNLVSLGDFSGSIKALTYPNEFLPLEGLAVFKAGVHLGEQRPEVFALSYRSKVGNDLDVDAGYKIHIIYNVIVTPKDRTHDTISDSPSAEDFEWDISAIPQEVVGFAPTAHIVLNTIDIDSELLASIEAILYGNETENPSLISMDDLLTLIGFPSLLAVEIIDNGDGTWTAIGDTVVDNGDGSFTITNANAIFPAADRYKVSSTHA